MSIAPAAVIAEARSWIGTPFHHQARTKGQGVDCLGLVIGVARALRLVPPDFDVAPYGPEPLNGLLQQGLRTHLHPAIEGPGALALIRWQREPQHVGILSDTGTIIHAWDSAGRVVEHGYTWPWRKRTVAFYALPGVSHG